MSSLSKCTILGMKNDKINTVSHAKNDTEVQSLNYSLLTVNCSLHTSHCSLVTAHGYTAHKLQC